jgi:protein phosphatase
MRHGEMTEAEAAVHPQRHILTRALGVSAEVETDMWELHLRTGDRVLLCSDGLTNEVGLDEIAEILVSVNEPEQAARSLVDVANDHGGSDNITVIVVEVQVGDEGGDSDATVLVTPVGLDAIAPVGAAGANGAEVTSVPLAEPPPGHPGTESNGLPTHDALASGADLGFGEEPATIAVQTVKSDELLEAPPVPVARTSTRVAPAPPVREVVPEKESRGARRRRLGIPRRITLRVLAFFLLVAAVPVTAYLVLRWYAYDNWTVTLQGDRVVIKQGQPGGVLWFHPRLAERTHYTVANIPAQTVPAVKAGVQESSLANARRYVSGLRAQATTTTTTTSTTTTTTTAPPSTTTTGGVATTPTFAPPLAPGPNP